MTNANVKNFVIRVSANTKFIEFHTAVMGTAVPSLPFTIGDDPMNVISNVPNIIKHIRDMIRVEGYNTVTCLPSDLVIYHEIISGLKTIPDLTVKIM